MTVTDRGFWQEAWGAADSAKRYLTLPSGFEPFFRRYFTRAEAGRHVDFLEIGCFPGRFLYHFAKEFNYRVFGIDFVPQAAAIPQWLAELGVEAQVTVADFFFFEPQRQYDVVASFGFVEHFPNWQEVLERHLALLKPAGTLIVEMPNFRYGQYWLRRFLNAQVLEGHFLGVMDPVKWAQALEQHGLKVLYSGYYQTFRLWGGLAGRGFMRLLRKIVMEPLRFLQKVIKIFHIDYPNRYFSPYIIIVARHPGVLKTNYSFNETSEGD
jgi:SAM-dependent methyltransferase